jgi:hypothetical protein
MNQNQIENALLDLNKLVMEGKLMDAFEKYYHEDVQMQENGNAPVVGKEQNRQRELQFLSSITDFRGASVNGHAVGHNISFVVWNYDYTHKEWGVRNYTQVSVQHWKDGQIIKEQFYYGN